MKALADLGRPFGAIAGELGIDRNTVTAAWRHWHESRELPVPDGRVRRKALRLAAADTQPAPQPDAATLDATPPMASTEPGSVNPAHPDHTWPAAG